MAAAGTDYKVRVINSSSLEDASDGFFVLNSGIYQASLDQVPGNVQPQGAPQGNTQANAQSPSFFNKPDFEILDIERLAGGIFWAKLRNNGNSAYNGPLTFHVDFGANGDGLITVPVNVPAKGTQSVSLVYYLRNEDLADRGRVPVKVVADSDDKVVEINENNNEKSCMFFAPCPVYVKKFEISVSPAESSGPYPLPLRLTLRFEVIGSGELKIQYWETNCTIRTRKYAFPASGSYTFVEDLLPVQKIELGSSALACGNSCWQEGGFCWNQTAKVIGCGQEGSVVESNTVALRYTKSQ
jgi:hypothetical protein